MRKILYSPGFGAGWVTWNKPNLAEFLLTYEPIIEFLEAGNKFTDADARDGHPLLAKLREEVLERFNESYVCVLGASDLKVAYVDGKVRINEYDGSEDFETEDSYEGWL